MVVVAALFRLLVLQLFSYILGKLWLEHLVHDVGRSVWVLRPKILSMGELSKPSLGVLRQSNRARFASNVLSL